MSTITDDIESVGNRPWTQGEIDALKNKHKRVHFTHFQGVSKKPTHPKDDPNWVYLGGGRWRRKPFVQGADMARGDNEAK